jgi:hypothetical protein
MIHAMGQADKPKRAAPTFLEALALAEGEGREGPAKPSAATKLAQLMARAHREEDPGKRPILVTLPPKRAQ